MTQSTMRIHPAATPAPKSAPKQSQAAKQKPKTTNAYASSNQKHDEQKAPQRTADTPSDVLANAAAETKRDKGVYASMKRAFSPYVENHSHAVLYGIIFGATDALVGVFNSESSAQMAQFAHMGMRLYFVGYFFAGFNIVAAGYLSATNRPVEASVTSICRGMVAIVACSLVLSRLFGMNGVWAAFPASELLTAVLTLFLLLRGKKQTA